MLMIIVIICNNEVEKGVIVRIWIILISGLMVFSVQAERLVSAGGSITEIIYALGAGEQLVGVDSSSQYPDNVKTLPSIGYYRTLNVEGILSVEPDTLVLLDGAGPSAVVQQLESLGLKISTVSNPKSISGLVSTIKEVASIVSEEEQGQVLVDTLHEQLMRVKQLPSVVGKRAVFLMSAGERGLIAAGSNTTPQLIFDQLGVTNPFAALQGFKSVSAEVIASEQPDIILLATHTSHGTSEDALCNGPQLRLWAGEQGCQLFKVDSLPFLGLTPRLPSAIEQTHQLLVQHAD